MQKVTLWYIFDKEKGTFVHNHLESGWVDGKYPKPKSPEFKNQQAWKKQEWVSRFKLLNENYQIVDVLSGT